jgi:hypothetical protein
VIVGSFATSRPVKSSQVLEPAQHVENRWSLVGAPVDALGDELLEGRVIVAWRDGARRSAIVICILCYCIVVSTRLPVPFLTD